MLFTKEKKYEKVFAYHGAILAVVEALHCLMLMLIYVWMLNEESVSTYYVPGEDRTYLAVFLFFGILSTLLILFGYPLGLVFQEKKKEACLVVIWEIIALAILALIWLIFVSICA
jgi:hypothetical protein